MAMVGYAGYMRQALAGSLSLYTQYRETTGSSRRVLDYLKVPTAVVEAPGAVDPGRLEGGISFSGVNFSYDGKHKVLEGVEFSVSPGQHVALVGGEEGAFPDRAFIEFAIAHHGEHPLIGATQTGAEGEADSDGKAVAERAGGRLHTRKAGIGQTLQISAVGEIASQILAAQPAFLIHAGVLGHDAMALAQHQIISPGRPRIITGIAQVIAIEDGEQFDERKGATDMDGGTGIGHVQHGLAQDAGIVGLPWHQNLSPSMVSIRSTDQASIASVSAGCRPIQKVSFITLSVWVSSPAIR